MASTVIIAFEEFLKNAINLDQSDVDLARRSRDWLFDQIGLFQEDDTFPKHYSQHDIHYGSFARRTKKRPLDDIDIMICLSAQGASYTEYSDRIEIYVNPETNLLPFCNDNTTTLNSIKIVNKFIRKLGEVPQYSKADMKRNGSAAVLSLKTYDWCFDIVPCFMTAQELSGRTFYLIPDGKGNWKKTDPRIDRDRTRDINQSHGGNVLNVIRLMKYWNQRQTMPSISSYLLETIVLDFYEHNSRVASTFVDIEFRLILEHISTKIYQAVADPKGIQGDINNLLWDDKTKISERAILDLRKINDARNLENEQDYEGSIKKWSEIFGGEFPEYG